MGGEQSCFLGAASNLVSNSCTWAASYLGLAEGRRAIPFLHFGSRRRAILIFWGGEQFPSSILGLGGELFLEELSTPPPGRQIFSIICFALSPMVLSKHLFTIFQFISASLCAWAIASHFGCFFLCCKVESSS